MSLFPDEILVYVILKYNELVPGYAESIPIGVFKGTKENLDAFMLRNYNDPQKYHTVKVPHYCEKGIACCGCKFYEDTANEKEGKESDLLDTAGE